MADLKQNTWVLDEWYDQAVAGNTTYQGAVQLWVAGNNERGRNGQNNAPVSYPWGTVLTGQVSSPVQVGAGGDWAKVCQRSNSMISAIKTDGSLWSWGYNGDGQLGLNNRTSRSSPCQIGTPGTWRNFWSGYASLGIKETGDYTTMGGPLYSWGGNSHGANGLNQPSAGSNFGKASSPTQVGTQTDWVAVSSDSKTSTGLRIPGRTVNYGNLYTWGYGFYGNLGNNLGGYPWGNQETRSISSPWLVPGGNWIDSAHGNYAIYGMKNDGTVWAWGRSQQQNMGTSPGGSKSSPTQVGTEIAIQSWDAMASAYQGGYLLKNGNLYAWGKNNVGELGQNDTDADSEPTLVGNPGDNNWAVITNSFTSGAQGVKTDGTVWVWGTNGRGQLGDNQERYGGYSSPTQVFGEAGVDSSWKGVTGITTGTKYIGYAPANNNMRMLGGTGQSQNAFLKLV
jgi:alpha-tubulin suppressor-like RCC1 family protein|tara:strand:+ start:45 stop:1397 length:1353 start_codon:yes stop_codon:yes gene_type:complete